MSAFVEGHSIGLPIIRYRGTAATVTIFYEGGLYHAVDWGNTVYIETDAELQPLFIEVQTYLIGLGGGSIFFNLIGAHYFNPTATVSLDGLMVFGLGKSTVLRINPDEVVSMFEVEAIDVTFQNLAFDGYKGSVVWPVGGEVDAITVQDPGLRTLVMACYFHDWGGPDSHPIEVKTNSDVTDVLVVVCHFKDNNAFSVAFASAGGHCIALSCTFTDTSGVEAGGFGSYNITSSCTFTGSLLGQPSVLMNFAYNFTIGCTFSGTVSAQIIADNCSIIGGILRACIDQGLLINGGDDALIVGVSIFASTNRQAGVTVWDNTNRTVVMSCRISCLRGIFLNSGTAADTHIFNINFNGTTTPVFINAGTPTIICHVVSLQFNFGSGTYDADGLLIDLAAEYAAYFGQIPLWVSQVLKLEAWGVTNTTTANRMRAEFWISGGADNESKTTHIGDIANHPSTSVNFTAEDIIHWEVRTAGVLALKGGDSVKAVILYEDAGDGDVVTNFNSRTMLLFVV